MMASLVYDWTGHEISLDILGGYWTPWEDTVHFRRDAGLVVKILRDLWSPSMDLSGMDVFLVVLDD